MTDKLLFDITDKIATITFNNPEKLNAFTMEMLVAYRERLEECRTREDVWAIIVTGAGRGFCSGGDTGRMGADTPPTPAEIKSGLWDLVQLISLKMTEIDKPIIAAVNGVAVGAGMDMSLHADLRIAAESARFAETYVRVGLVPGNGGAWFLPRLIGMPRALEMLWSADFVDAQKALEYGLVNKVVPDDKLMEETRAYVGKLVNSSPISVRLIKRTMKAGLNMDLRSSLDMVSSHMVLARSSEDHKEAIAAWREKRPGNYKNC
ncbi:MAG: enoyl-CoA hydratase-related protein [Pseudomonadota bacterium]|nr:enoyl-CoA hydratase-related protein [Pseudomonadota bacterium]